ncbi:Phenylacetic acid catabolic protein [Lacisediminimonas profundi]|uniref:Phenylacetic acid catabolic protein n=1 Tax=Lacisediminimonas profundi TaxID=2603856 RepID=UPI00124B98EF|nr:Phenylacetic acid catabolic protein [Lacisediminimonas profundi]
MSEAAVQDRADARIYKENDPDLPEEFRTLLVRVMSKHLENSTNPHYDRLLVKLWERCLTLAPDVEAKRLLAKLMMQEVEHGVITAQILKGLGVDKIEEPIEQYIFNMPMDTWCDLCFFHALGDRVGMYIGENWGDVPYEPLRAVAPRLHRDEVFHATLGYQNLTKICETPEGLAQAQELIHKWWPAALDMFGTSGSTFSEKYVRWGIRQQGNEELRQQYIADTRPLMEKIGIVVPDDRANRKFL